MPPEVVPVTDANADGYWDIISRVYNSGEPVPAERRISGNDRRFAAFDDQRCVGVYRILDFTIAVGTGRTKCAGIAAVGVAPEVRRSGVGSAMMTSCIRSCFRDSITYTSLYAYREPFYRRFGYEVVGSRLRLSVPSHRLPSVPQEISVRVLTPADYEQLVGAYDAFASVRAGSVIRTAEQWRRVLAESKSLTIYAAGDPVEAYAAVSHDTTFWVNQHISEFIWGSKRGYDAVLATISALSANKTSMSWYEPSDSPYVAQYLDQGMTIGIERPFMMRVCDVGAALNLLAPPGNGTATFSVEDEIVRENSGTWTVNWRDGAVISVKKSDANALGLTIQQLTQALLGEPSYADLSRNKIVPVDANLARMFPARPVYCLDFF